MREQEIVLEAATPGAWGDYISSRSFLLNFCNWNWPTIPIIETGIFTVLTRQLVYIYLQYLARHHQYGSTHIMTVKLCNNSCITLSGWNGIVLFTQASFYFFTHVQDASIKRLFNFRIVSVVFSFSLSSQQIKFFVNATIKILIEYVNKSKFSSSPKWKKLLYKRFFKNIISETTFDIAGQKYCKHWAPAKTYLENRLLTNAGEFFPDIN